MATQVVLPVKLGRMMKGQTACIAYIVDDAGVTLGTVIRPSAIETEQVAVWTVNAINRGAQHA